MIRNTFKSALITALVMGAIASASAQTDEQVEYIARNSDTTSLLQLSDRLSKGFQDNYQRALELAKQNNWDLQIQRRDGGVAVLQGVSEDGTTPLYVGTSNYGSTLTSRTNTIQPGGSEGLNLDGTNMIAGLWELNKPLTSHLDFLISPNVPTSGSRIYYLDSETVALADHPTHVSGTMIGSGLNDSTDPTHLHARGMAFKAKIYAWEITNDLSEMAAAAATRGLLVSNHSYGAALDNFNQQPTYFRSLFGGYNADAHDFDAMGFKAPFYQALKAAGNDRNGANTYNPGKNGHDLLTGWANAKNSLVVAAVNEVPNYTGASSVVMSSFSNWGPTDDNRIKPDISNKGVAVYSTTCNPSNVSANNLYQLMDGTSMATPGTTGALLLIQQHYSNLNSGKFMRSATLRGMVAHCADEAGDYDGPDSKFGWGLLNVQRMAKIISDRASNGSIVREDNLVQGAVYTRTVYAVGGGVPLIATLSWTEKPGVAIGSTVIDSTTPVLVNDLDIRITKDDQTYYPWRLASSLDVAAEQGDNIVDNIEKVELKLPDAGVYTITISHKGTLDTATVPKGSQDYSLIVSGIDPALGVDQNDFSKFSVWPNPVKDRLNVSMESNLSGEADVLVYDVLGKKVLERNISGNGNVFSDAIDVSVLNSGIYILKVTQAGQTSVRKFVKE